MIETKAFWELTHSGRFLHQLGLQEGTELSFSVLGQGEYNLNYLFVHPVSGKRLVVRINTGSQMHLQDQIAYEFSALQALEPSGRTPKPLFCDDSRELFPYGILVMEWLPGRPLRYESDLADAAQILADIHTTPVPQQARLLRPEYPAQAIFEECLEMVEHYYRWEKADSTVCRLLEQLVREIGKLPLKEAAKSPRCIVNTELNSGNFLINQGAKSYLIDWEKPILSEPEQDLGHFLVPTTTFWKTDTILTPEEIRQFVGLYRQAVGERLALSALSERLPLYFTVTCLRGVTWCAMAMREYSQPDRPLVNADTFRKIREYLSPDFLERILNDYVRRDFLKGE